MQKILMLVSFLEQKWLKKNSFFHFLALFFLFFAKKHTKIQAIWLKFGMELRMDVENLHVKFCVDPLSRLGTAVPKSPRYPTIF